MDIDRTKRAKRNILWGVINRILTMVLPFANRTVIIYALGAEYLGLDSLFTSILQMLNLAELGFSSAITYCMYKPVAEHDNNKICALLNLYKKVYRVIGTGVFFLGVFLVPFLDKLIKSDLPSNVNLYGLYFIFLINTVIGYCFFAYKKSIITANQREDIISNMNTFVVICKTIFQVVLVLVFHNYYLYIVVMPIMTIGENIFIAYVTKKHYPLIVPFGILQKEVINDIKKRIAGLMIQRVCAVSRNSLDSIVISAFIGLNMVTIYGNYYYIMYAVHNLMCVIPNAITAIVGNTIVNKSREETHFDMLKFTFLYMWIASNATTCLLCLFQPFMKLWMGENMLMSTPMMVAMCIYFYGLCMGDILSVYVTGSGIWWEGRFRALLEAITNLILNIVLGWYLGIFGIIIATVISLLVINFGYGSNIVYNHYFKNRKVHVYFGLHFYYAGITCIIGMLAFVLCELLPYTGIINMILRAILCLVLTNFIWLIFCCRLPVYKAAKDFIFNLFITKKERL